jgi:hypothetical protein
MSSPGDKHFPVSPRLATINAGHDKSTPTGAATPNAGASPTEIGHDRLMSTVPPRPDKAPPAPCPTCGAPGDGHLRTGHGITIATYLCTAGHGWMTKWANVSDGAA